MGLFFPDSEKRSGPSAGELVQAAQMMRLAPKTVNVTDSVALTHSAVWACASLYARLISTLPFHAYRQAGGIDARIPDPQILRQPNGTQPLTSWLSQAVYSLVLRGNVYGLILSRNNMALPMAVQILHPDLVAAEYDWRTDAITYKVGGVEVDASAIWHRSINTMPGSPIGISALTAARQSVGMGVAAQQFGSQWFTSGGIPTGTLETDAELTAEQAAAIKDRWQHAVTTERGVAILGQGFSYKPISIAPQDAEWLNAQKISVQDVCRFFGVPPEMVGSESGASMTYSNVESRALDLLRYAIDPVLVVLESGMTDLLPRPQYVQATRDALLRMTTLDRYNAHASAISAGWKTVDEVRQIEDLPPLPEPTQEPIP
jgi:HK97 family phage portal protein